MANRVLDRDTLGDHGKEILERLNYIIAGEKLVTVSEFDYEVLVTAAAAYGEGEPTTFPRGSSLPPLPNDSELRYHQAP